MTDFFVDTSALAKRYIIESGSAWVRSWILPEAANTIIISALSQVEMVSLLMRRERESAVANTLRIQAQNNFLLHMEREYIVVSLNDSVLALAREMLIKHPLRTLDAVQLACGLEVQRRLLIDPTFVTADKRLFSAAQAEGFPVDDPHNHP